MELHFLRPWWLLALVPWLMLVWWLARRRLAAGGWERVCDPGLLPYVLEQRETRRSHWPLWLAAVAGLIAITALAGPAWDRLPQPVYRDQGALVIALDLSRSMDATDLEPSRLERARYKISDILAARPSGVTALLVYAGDAFTVTPLSTDTATIEALVGVLATDLMPAGGSRTDRALSEARSLLQQAGYRQGDVLLITDDSDPAAARAQAEALHAEGYRLSVLGVGTAEGAPVPLGEGRLLKDDRGGIVIPRLDAGELAALARAGGGLYQTMRSDPRDIERLTAFWGEQPAEKAEDRHAERWRDRGPWLVLLLIPMAALAFRRGLLLAALLVVIIPYPSPAAALDWASLWQRPDQRARAALQAGEPERAAELFTDPEWRAVAFYRSGDYAQALKALESVETARGWYNRGNALARLGRYPQAIAAYEEALARDPDMEDARYNRDLLREQLQQQSSPPQSQSQSAPASDETDSKAGVDAGSGGVGRQEAEAGGSEQAGAKGGQAPVEGMPSAGDNGTSDPQGAGFEDERRKVGGEQPEEGEAEQDEPRSAAASETDPAAEAGAQSTRLAESESPDEQLSPADERRLQRIPDDPGGLLRRKFEYQYQRRHSTRPSAGEPAW